MNLCQAIGKPDCSKSKVQKAQGIHFLKQERTISDILENILLEKLNINCPFSEI